MVFGRLKSLCKNWIEYVDNYEDGHVYPKQEIIKMSVFVVNLQNVQQGLLDINPTTGQPFAVSQQRQCFVMGPLHINRLLKDGATFTDCNYWKQFAYPQASYERAFIEVLVDDGSVYSSVPVENTFAVGNTYTLATVFNTTNTIDFVGTYGAPARFLQVTNMDPSIAITGQLNASSNITFTLAANETQVFNANDLAITMLQLKSASGTPRANVIASVRSVSTS
jgi:hypothetical protein